MTICLNCTQNTADFTACMHCGARLRPETSDRHKAVFAAVHTRLDQLMRSAHKLDTLSRHQGEFAAFATFCLQQLGFSAAQAAPPHVIAYLIQADQQGRTTVHIDTCPAQRPTGDSTQCLGQCPTRLKHSSLRVKVANLRAAFEELGCTAPWAGGFAANENPCTSRAVNTYVDAVGKEQLHAGVATRTAPMFDRDLFVSAVSSALELRDEAARHGAIEDVWWHTQAAAAMSFLFFWTDRSHNVCELKWGDIRLLPATTLQDGTPRAAQAMVTIRLSKSVASTMEEREALIPDLGDGYSYSPLLLLHQLKACVRQILKVADEDMSTMHVFVPQGPPARRAEKLKHAQTTHLAQQSLQTIVENAMTTAGVPPGSVTLHSFRASGAKDQILRGVPTDEILRAYHWRDERMMSYYTELRACWTTEGATRDKSAWPASKPATPCSTEQHKQLSLPLTTREGEAGWRPWNLKRSAGTTAAPQEASVRRSTRPTRGHTSLITPTSGSGAPTGHRPHNEPGAKTTGTSGRGSDSKPHRAPSIPGPPLTPGPTDVTPPPPATWAFNPTPLLSVAPLSAVYGPPGGHTTTTPNPDIPWVFNPRPTVRATTVDTQTPAPRLGLGGTTATPAPGTSEPESTGATTSGLHRSDNPTQARAEQTRNTVALRMGG